MISFLRTSGHEKFKTMRKGHEFFSCSLALKFRHVLFGKWLSSSLKLATTPYMIHIRHTNHTYDVPQQHRDSSSVLGAHQLI